MPSSFSGHVIFWVLRDKKEQIDVGQAVECMNLIFCTELSEMETQTGELLV